MAIGSCSGPGSRLGAILGLAAASVAIENHYSPSQCWEPLQPKSRKTPVVPGFEQLSGTTALQLGSAVGCGAWSQVNSIRVRDRIPCESYAPCLVSQQWRIWQCPRWASKPAHWSSKDGIGRGASLPSCPASPLNQQSSEAGENVHESLLPPSATKLEARESVGSSSDVGLEHPAMAAIWHTAGQVPTCFAIIKNTEIKNI